MGLKSGTQWVPAPGLSTMILIIPQNVVLCLCLLNENQFEEIWDAQSWPDILLSMTHQLLPKNRTLHAKERKTKTGEKCTVTFGHHHLCSYFYRSLYRVMTVWMWHHSVKSHHDHVFYITLQTSTAVYFPNMSYLFQISPAPYLLIWKHHLRGPPGSHVLKNLHDNYSMVMV